MNADNPPTLAALVRRLRQMGCDVPDDLSAEDAAFAINSFLSSEAMCGRAYVNGKPCFKFRQWFEHVYQQKWEWPAYLKRERA